MAKIFCVANQKGGVGKTTTAVNLAASLAAQGQRVLLIDLDPQGNATMGSGVDKAACANTVYEVLVDGVSVADARVRPEAVGYDVLPANRELAGAEVELVSVQHRERQLKVALAEVESEYEFVLIDCPPALSLLTLNGLCAAHGVVIPMQCEYFALEGLSDLVKHDQAGAREPESRLEGDRPAARDVRSTYHLAAASLGSTERALWRQGVRCSDPAQRTPCRGALAMGCRALCSIRPRAVRRRMCSSVQR